MRGANISSAGPEPGLQRHWDWRAAGNFMGGGAGSGLIVFAVLSGVQGTPLAVALLAGLALVGAGLACVWAEIGRPWRALNVFLNPRTSWMSRESALAALLFPATLAAAWGVPGMRWVALVVAAGFLVAQSRIVRAARGIPAWRAPLAATFIVATGLAEGGGLMAAASVATGADLGALPWLWGAILLARALVWQAYRQSLDTPPTARALRALEPAGRTLLWVGTALPLGLFAIVVAWPVGTGALMGVAGLAAAATGARVKHALITRASFNQGFALARLPVRGARP